VGVEGEAEEVGGDEAGLRGAEGDHADDDAIEGGESPSVPVVAPDEDGGDDGEQTRDVVEAEQSSEYLGGSGESCLRGHNFVVNWSQRGMKVCAPGSSRSSRRSGGRKEEMDERVLRIPKSEN